MPASLSGAGDEEEGLQPEGSSSAEEKLADVFSYVLSFLRDAGLPHTETALLGEIGRKYPQVPGLAEAAESAPAGEGAAGASGDEAGGIEEEGARSGGGSAHGASGSRSERGTELKLEPLLLTRSRCRSAAEEPAQITSSARALETSPGLGKGSSTTRRRRKPAAVHPAIAAYPSLPSKCLI
jgi:hypothetical protein